jgi:hypothetical protein
MPPNTENLLCRIDIETIKAEARQARENELNRSAAMAMQQAQNSLQSELQPSTPFIRAVVEVSGICIDNPSRRYGASD